MATYEIGYAIDLDSELVVALAARQSDPVPKFRDSPNVGIM